MVVREGDWVRGATEWDEFFIGFIDKENFNGTMKVFITQCDHEGKLNTSIEIKANRLKRLPDSAPLSLEELDSLIELALMTHDKEWFLELQAQRSAFRVPKSKTEHKQIGRRVVDRR